MLFIYLEKLGNKILSKELNIIQSHRLQYKWQKEDEVCDLGTLSEESPDSLLLGLGPVRPF